MAEHHDRYLKTVDWARARYRNLDGSVTNHVGVAIAKRVGIELVPTRYAMIEDLAARRHLGSAPRYPHETLATAYGPAPQEAN